jgi:hypothetical protein
MTGAWQDGRGCLTEAGLAALAAAPPGQAPPELASHLAACPRCQQRLLAGPGQPRRPRRRPPPPWRILAVLGGLLLAALALLVLIRRLS